MNKLWLVLIAAIGMGVAGCHKSTQSPSTNNKTYNTSFTLSDINVYLNSALYVNATDTTNTQYNWDFGDGITLQTSKATASHAYTKAGTYTVTLKEGASSTQHRVRIYPGQFSFQVSNALDRSLVNIQTRITDANNTNEFFVNNGTLDSGHSTDTVFVTLLDSKYTSQILVDGTIASNNKNTLNFGTGAAFTLGKHLYFNITPTVLCNVYGTTGTIALPGSAVPFSSAIANY